MKTRRYRPLPAKLKSELAFVPSADGLIFPCSVVRTDNSVLDRVYIASANPWFTNWGIWPEDDPGKRSIKIETVKTIRNSQTRLPKRFAAKLYEAGESGMGYTIFTVIFENQSSQAYISGNAVDFIDYPTGQTPVTVTDVLPHVGRDDPKLRKCPDYTWCLFGA